MHAISKRSGFTLIELMLVIVVVSILTGMALLRFRGVTARAKQAEAEPILRQIYTLEERHRARTGSYTMNLADLEGGTGLSTSGEYYTYSVGAHQSGFCVSASPTATATAQGLEARSMDATRSFYDTANCN